MSFEQNRGLKGALGKLPAPTSRPRRAILCLAMVLPTLLAWGCSGIVSGQNSTPSQPPPQTFSISGTISPATGGNGATITISGAGNATGTANSSGNFTVSGLANGTYTVTPSHTGYTFSPTSQTATVSGANVAGINFTATVQQTHFVALSWNASTSAVIGYNVYRSTVSGTGYTRINSALVVGPLVYTDIILQGGTTYYYVTTAVDSSGSESAYSNEAQAIIP